MSHVWTLLRECANRREQATTIALFRVLLCAGALFSLAIMARDDVFLVTWVSAKEGGISALSSRHWMFDVLGGFRADAVQQVFTFCCCTLFFGVIGFGGRLTLLFAQQSYVALRTINENASGGYDSLICLGLLVLACTASTSTLSLDCRLVHGRFWHPTQISTWPRAVLVFQVLLMYTMTGLQKVGHAWTPMGGYTALHFVLNDPTWLRWDLGPLPWSIDPLLRLGTAVTWHWEQLSILLLFHWYYRATGAKSPRWLRAFFVRWDIRYPWAAIGLVMHAGILLLFDVGPFSLVSVAFYVNLWSPGEWQRGYSTLRTFIANRTRLVARANA
jgi:hypothetical protein